MDVNNLVEVNGKLLAVIIRKSFCEDEKKYKYFLKFLNNNNAGYFQEQSLKLIHKGYVGIIDDIKESRSNK